MLKSSVTIIFFFISFQVFSQEFKINKEPVFEAGEELYYKIKYGPFKVGKATIQVLDSELEFDNKSVFHLIGEGQTTGLFSFFNKVRNRYESYVDKKKLTPYFYIHNSRGANYYRNDQARFYQQEGRIIAQGKSLEAKNQTFDLISGCYFSRNLDLTNIKEGDVLSIYYFMENTLTKFTITYLGNEVIKTIKGDTKCLRFSSLVLDEGKILKKNGKIIFWVTDDKNRIPVKVQAETSLGSVAVELAGANGVKYYW